MRQSLILDIIQAHARGDNVAWRKAMCALYGEELLKGHTKTAQRIHLAGNGLEWRDKKEE